MRGAVPCSLLCMQSAVSSRISQEQRRGTVAMSRCARCPSPAPTVQHTRPLWAPGRWEGRVGVPSGRAVRTTSRHVYLGLFIRDTDAAKARRCWRRGQLVQAASGRRAPGEAAAAGSLAPLL